MLCFQHGMATNKLTAFSKADDFIDLVNYPVATHSEIADISRAKQYKADKALFVIAGTFTKLVRNNAYLTNRTVLFMDIDSTSGDDYQTSVQTILSAFSGLNLYVYPTVSNGYQGTRLRIAVPTDRPFNSAQRTLLGQYLASKLPDDWQTDATSFRHNWSQLAGMPVLNHFSSEHDNQPLAITHQASLKVDTANLHTAQNSLQPTKNSVRNTLKLDSYIDRQPWQTTVNQTLSTLVHPPSSNRHLYFASLIGSLNFLKLDSGLIGKLVTWSNSLSDKPLDSQELKRVINSVSSSIKGRRLYG